VSELLQRISSKELTEWMAFEQLEPFGPFANNYNSAMIASMIANVFSDGKTIRPQDLALGEFETGKKDGVQTTEEQKKILMALAGKTKKD